MRRSFTFVIMTVSIVFFMRAALQAQQPDIIWQVHPSTSAVTSVLFSPDGSRLAVTFAGQDRLIYILDGASGEHLATCEIPLPAADEIDPYTHYIFSPDGQYLYFAVRGTDWVYPTQIRVRKWSVATGSLVVAVTFFAEDNLEEHDVFRDLQLFSFAHSSLIGIAVDTELFGIRSSGQSGMLYCIDTQKDSVISKHRIGELGGCYYFCRRSVSVHLQVFLYIPASWKRRGISQRELWNNGCGYTTGKKLESG